MPSARAVPTRKLIVLLIEGTPDLAELERLILEDAGYQVEVTPPNARAVPTAQRIKPAAIVLGIPPVHPEEWEIVDQLNTNPDTRTIPVVVISTGESTVAAAKATPNVREGVVAPYDISALQTAVARALGNPPPAAVLPPARQQVSPSRIAIADALTRQARHVVLATLRTLQAAEPFRSRFPELSTALVDELGTILGGIIAGIRRALPPDDVVAAPSIRQAAVADVNLRIRQGIPLVGILWEYQALRDQVDIALHALLEHAGISTADLFDVARDVSNDIDALVRIVVEEYLTARGEG